MLNSEFEKVQLSKTTFGGFFFLLEEAVVFEIDQHLILVRWWLK